ncbi:MAG: 4Fe-4S binding protein [Oscillospiraceae bacterium]|jgi:formate hydrogenlyase subunit 6/NADH:ubiquinone oxidoreductase subunit I|nr:4Fe-4S binding protein [Oscillospiraceae bacterium]
MKPKVNDKRCGASHGACKAIKVCPTGAIGYIEVDEPVLERVVACNNNPSIEGASSCDCDCGGDVNGCGGSPYGRIIIDYDKCIKCGICAKACCGSAIDMV